jgi:peptidyl-prolyl cis-trans isomerase C
MILSPAYVFAAEQEAKVVATIGDKVFTTADFQRWMELNTKEGQKAIAADNKKKANMLNQIITAMVIADVARKEGFDKRPDIAEKMQMVTNNFLTLEYLDKVVSAKVEPTEEEINQYYTENSQRFHMREQVRARHILIKTDAEMDDAAKAEARKKAEELLAQVRAGSDFAALAHEHSEDPMSRERGGDLGLFSRGRMVTEFETAAFSMQPGETSEIVETKFGYHIIRIEERQQGKVKPLAEVREMIVTTLSREKKREAVDKFVQQAMQDARAEVDVRALLGPDPHL